ncbi:MAG: NAD(P)/FAD-dependent oxidoreductase [Fimbriimonas sp.]|nr:NAD(P)/FAD-dependent oxidoreductase [Fimbriimonas sp.]
MQYDVAIIGGGPAGTTAGTLLKKYQPDLNVVILEREKFPRDHIGESQLPAISMILHEMGAWDKIEAANFPIKIGSTNRWGKVPELWDFEFYPSEKFEEQERPAKFEGQRRFTAFQVDRSIYDKILLDHAAECGVEVREQTTVKEILKTGDRVDGLTLADGDVVTAKHYLDASGHTGILRRAMGVTCEYPSTLQNIALWDYWQNAEWAVEIGVGATKIQVMSLGYGWIWFIPLGPTRTSIGLVVPAEYYKERGIRPEDLYMEALGQEERISGLITNATREGKFTSTKDWSFLSSRQSGENWFLIGESAGFADPILSAGMTMAHCGGREVACTILELEKGQHDSAWLREQFDLRQSQRVTSHIRFADFWYTANAQFQDIKECIQRIAGDAGLDLTPDHAWDWLARGGFIDEDLSTGVGGFSLLTVKGLSTVLADLPQRDPLSENNMFKLNLAGASVKERAEYSNGGIKACKCYVRGAKVLPVDGRFKMVIGMLQRSSSMDHIIPMITQFVESFPDSNVRYRAFTKTMEAFEALIADGWVIASCDPNKQLYRIEYHDQTIRLNKDTLH